MAFCEFKVKSDVGSSTIVITSWQFCMKLEFISSPDCSGKPAKFEACKTQVPKRPAGALGTPMFCRMKTADLKRKAGSWL
ncbi:hypothetical protein [Psychroflexus salis]|uniref:Uncharacterized protein n=1 Tax=Psychroflexus salis TaxID=1526574 RepID=A0A917E8C5_9FLAO|nr:hypothetical protein [Psychroflexus salis]GGE14105.1 hypothetical protein GCM10010831_14340 [Psychroflexus salis]